MSEHPLTPQNTTIVVVGWNVNQIDDALAQYGTDAAGVTIVKITDGMNNLDDALALPNGTPWCALSYANPIAIQMLTQYLGAIRPLSDCLNMTPNDYAINPRLLQL